MKIIRQCYFFVILIFGLGVMMASSVAADSLNDWKWRNPLPQGNHLYGLAYGNSTYVAVGSGGVILTSADGVHWTTRAEWTSHPITEVTFGNGLFVAVCSNGDILTSPDGASWTSQNLRGEYTEYRFAGVAYGNGRFVAVGSTQISGGFVSATSTNGKTWTAFLSSYGGPPSAIAFGAGKFVTVGSTPHVSEDGLTWTPANIKTVTSGLNGIAYGNGTFVAVGIYEEIFTSTDGISWQDRTYLSNMASFAAVTFGNGKFVAVCNSMTNDYGSSIFTSTDGKTWTSGPSGTTDKLYAVTYGNGKFIAAGNWGRITSSADGKNWTSYSGLSTYFWGITYANGKFFAVGDWKILMSKDGITWTSAKPTNYYLYGLTYGNGIYVAVGDDGYGGRLLTSKDGVNWTERITGTGGRLLAVTYANGIFVAVGEYGLIQTSKDGVKWTAHSHGTGKGFWGVTYGEGKFVVVGSNSNGLAVILTSTDGIAWTSQSPGTVKGLYSVTYGEGKFVAVGKDETILTSLDGEKWILRNSEASDFYGSHFLFGVTYGYGTFVAVGWYGDTFHPLSGYGANKILTSSDGITWTAADSQTANILYGVAYGDGKFVAAGVGGTILQSGDVRQFSIIGKVTNAAGSPMVGVPITLGGSANMETATDSIGKYHFAGLYNDGTYTIKPALTGYFFTPIKRSVTIKGANVTSQNFTGAK